MNASPVSASSSVTARPETKAARTPRSWIFSLTGVCFIFGALLAMQLRANQQIQVNHAREKQGIVAANKLAADMKVQADKATTERVKLNVQLDILKDQLKSGAVLSKTQVAALNGQIKDLQTIAALTPISGAGVRITLSDNPNAAQATADTAFLPGLVHDFDILQVVNELRSAKADAIAVKGAGDEVIRVTGYTPIRCVGPTILVNWEAVAAPFTIEAIGDPAKLRSALDMPNGIIDQLKNNGAIGVKISAVNDLKLPASIGGGPKLSQGKATS